MCFSNPKYHPLPSLSALLALQPAGAAGGSLHSFAEPPGVPGTAGGPHSPPPSLDGAWSCWSRGSATATLAPLQQFAPHCQRSFWTIMVVRALLVQLHTREHIRVFHTAARLLVSGFLRSAPEACLFLKKISSISGRAETWFSFTVQQK